MDINSVVPTLAAKQVISHQVTNILIEWGADGTGAESDPSCGLLTAGVSS